MKKNLFKFEYRFAQRNPEGHFYSVKEIEYIDYIGAKNIDMAKTIFKLEYPHVDINSVKITEIGTVFI